MFSAFIEESYLKLFDGGSLLTPIVHPHTQLSQLATLGTVISYAYIVSGFLPIRVALPCLAAVMLGPMTNIPDVILLEAFVDSMSVHDAGVLKNALSITSTDTNLFPSTIQSGRLTVLSQFGCRQIPRPDNLKHIILEVSRFSFLLKPATAIATICSGIPSQQCAFWSQMSVDRLRDVYAALAVSSVRVLAMIEEPDYADPNQERVMTYLRQFVVDVYSVKHMRTLTG